jgi:hypothetical protein
MFPSDIEFKADEAWTFAHVRAVLAGASLPMSGMATSIGGANPGPSLWIFVLLGRVFGAATAPELARGVQICAGAALVGALLFARFAVDARQRELWYWAAALWAVNPLAIIFERKIWPPSILALPMVGFVAAWWYRRTLAGAFVWGALGALMAQVHLAVAGLAAAVVLWTFLFARSDTRWGSWFIGSVVGAIPALPWLLSLPSGEALALRLRFPFPTFYVRWFTQPFGLGSDYTLGPAHLLDFLSRPHLWDHPTYIVAAAHLAVIVLAVTTLSGALLSLRGWRDDRLALIRGRDQADILIRAAFWGYGGILTAITALGAGAHRHYLIVLAWIMALWAAKTIRATFAANAACVFVGLCCLQLFISAALLSYIHEVQIIKGEFGATWGSQQPTDRGLGTGAR